MSVVRNKNLLFYSVHPNDKFSKDFLDELERQPLLKKQFILVCVNDPNIKIPDKIKQLNKVPVLVAAGFTRPILGNDAVSWLRNGAYQEKGNGFDFGSLNDKDSTKYAYFTDDLKPSEYNQFHNSDYNHGFGDKDSILNQQFSKLNENAHISTYDDSNELKKDISLQLNQRLDQLRAQRDQDVPRAVKRIGGLDDPQSNNNTNTNTNNNLNFADGSSDRGGNGNGLSYNPNPFANHNLQQGQIPPTLPFMMPNLGSQTGNRAQVNYPPSFIGPGQRQGLNGQGFQQSGPQLPFNMPGINNGLTSQMPQLPFQNNNLRQR
jgi:hypothetical protein